MSNVRIDQNGLPKGPVFEGTAPLQHRLGVTAVDVADPADDSGAVDCAGYEACRFDVTVSGVDIQSLAVQVLLWNSRQGDWAAGASRTLTAAGRYALAVPDARGAKLFLKVVSFSGTSFSLSADYVLS